MKAEQHAMTEQEWKSLPVTFGTEQSARLFGLSLNYVQHHAQELGGVKVAGHWVFSKPKAAAMLGLEQFGI